MYFLQLCGVLECQHVIAVFTGDKVCTLLLRKLPVVKEIAESLKIMHEATVLSQKADFGLSEFYKCWVVTKLKIHARVNQSSKTKLNSNLLKSIQKRERQLLDNDLMKCAMILDPRFCDELEAEQAFQTKRIMVDMWNVMKALRNSQVNDANTMDENENMASNADIFRNYMKSKGKQRQIVLENTTTNDEFLDSIDSFIERESTEEGTMDDSWSILKFWDSKKKTYPLLYEIAMVIFAIAPTQVTIERLFSVFAHIFNDYRTSLSQRLLEDILMICLNPDLFDEVNAEDINYLLTTKNDP